MRSLNSYYNGFSISGAAGNNAFSLDRRLTKSIYVPALVDGDVGNVRPGEEIVFSEYFDGREIRATGLEHFVHIQKSEKDIFVFDNHNHAFFFWCYTYRQGLLKAPAILLHIDQHTDMRKPDIFPENFSLDNMDLDQAFAYTNFQLNVGNFIQPAVQMGLFRQTVMVTNEEAFQQPLPAAPFVLDLDLDIFAEDMDYIPDDLKMAFIQAAVSKARVITIATSPYFIDQAYALRKLEKCLVCL